MGGTVRQPSLLEPAQLGERGTGHVYSGTWFAAGEGLPVAASMNLRIPELMGGMPTGAIGDWPSWGGEGSYEVVFAHIYPSR